VTVSGGQGGGRRGRRPTHTSATPRRGRDGRRAGSADVRFHPSDGLSTNPNEPLYWERAALAKELERSFELCHSCRMCFKYCQSFPTLFAAMDEHGDVETHSDATLRRVVDECFQCKLCYTQCPYTEKERHPFRLDFPRLMLRAKAVRRKSEGIPLRDRLLADPDRLGRIGSRFSSLANWATACAQPRPDGTVRRIHRDKLLPTFAVGLSGMVPAPRQAASTRRPTAIRRWCSSPLAS